MVARVAALVSRFDKFFRVDEAAKRMTDLKAFHCQIVVDVLWDIPQNITIALGDDIAFVLVQLESSKMEGDYGGTCCHRLAILMKRAKGIRS